MVSDVKVFGTGRWANANEKSQFEGLKSQLLQCDDVLGDWAYMITNLPYHHDPVTTIENDREWDGEFDCILFARRFIVIYELKYKRIRLLFGRSDAKKWRIVYLDTGIQYAEPSYFDQVSKQRAHLLRYIMNRFKAGSDRLATMRFAVDARLVFLPGTDLGGFHHKIPKTYKRDEYFPEIYERSSADDRKFLDWAYVPTDFPSDLVTLRYGLKPEDFGHLRRILIAAGERPKTQKWFGIVTLDAVGRDLSTCGSMDNDMERNDVAALAHWLGVSELGAT